MTTKAEPVSVIIGRWFDDRSIQKKSLKSSAVLVSVYGGGLVAYRGIATRAPIQAIRLVLWLLAAQGRPISKDELIDLMFGNDPDGGPDDAEGAVRARIAEARTIAASLGLVLECAGFVGYEIRPVRKAAA